jgi:anthranilate phosphoribosyltransferase
MSSIDDHGGWAGLLTLLLDRHHLTAEQARAAMTTILSGDATPAQLIGFVVALRAKGESAEELSGLLDAVLAACQLVPLTENQRDNSVDIVGTGGDLSHSINVSTMAAIVVAGAGVPVCKHGARAASSKCGTADVLEELGVAIDLSPAGVKHCVDTAGIGFCFAPAFHSSFRFAGPSRREIGIPTVFNLLGPMANPGRVRRQVIGVANAAFAERMIETLKSHGSRHAWVVHGGGLDELTTTGRSEVIELDHGNVRHFRVDPEQLGFARAREDDLTGGEPPENAAAVRRVLAGDHGPHRDIVLLNAAAGLVVGGRATSLAEGVALAASTIDSGAAATTLERFVAASQDAAAA